MPEKATEKTFQHFAVLSILSRDAFGYVASGVMFLLILQARFDVLGLVLHGRALELPGELLVLLAALAVSYPLGRIAFGVGDLVMERVAWCKWDKLFHSAFEDLSAELPLNEIRPWGIQPTSENAQTLWGRMADRWVFMKRPDLFYAAVTRPNTLRILAETMLGLVMITGTILAVPEIPWLFPNGEWDRFFFVVGLGAILAILFGIQVWQTRDAQVRAEITAGFVVAAENPPVIAVQPPCRPNSRRVSVLAWGSLLWRPEDLPLDSKWELTGPELPIEFSRISSDGRLTLVLDRQNGVPVKTWVANLKATTTQDAAIALAAREKCKNADIGFIDLISGEHSSGKAGENVIWWVRQWMIRTGHTRVVWTALPSTFREKFGADFSVEKGLDYLRSLDGPKRIHALEYIRRAPVSTATPLREAFGPVFD